MMSDKVIDDDLRLLTNSNERRRRKSKKLRDRIGNGEEPLRRGSEAVDGSEWQISREKGKILTI